MLTEIAQITITTEESSNGPSFYLLASWIAGTAMLALVVLAGFGVVRIVKGKNTADSEATRKGLMQSALSLGGAVILGTTAGAIAWSADNETYNVPGAGNRGFANLMPAGARPQEVTVQRQGALVTCSSVVSLEADNAGRWFRTTHPTEEEHAAMESVLEANDSLDALKEQVFSQGSIYNGEYSNLEVPEDTWGETHASGEAAPGHTLAGARLQKVEWIPSSAEEGCTRENPHAASESEIRVTVWAGTGENGVTSDQTTDTFTVEAP